VYHNGGGVTGGGVPGQRAKLEKLEAQWEKKKKVSRKPKTKRKRGMVGTVRSEEKQKYKKREKRHKPWVKVSIIERKVGKK